MEYRNILDCHELASSGILEGRKLESMEADEELRKNNQKTKRGTKFKIILQKTKKTSFPKSDDDKNMKKMMIMKNFCICSLESSEDSLFPSRSFRFYRWPVMSSQEKFMLKAGNKPKPNIKFDWMPLPIFPMKPLLL
jgi:hypothetical protein